MMKLHPDRDPREILRAAIDEHRPARVIGLTSGGRDSTAALGSVAELLDYAAHIDTGTALPGVSDHAATVARTLGLEIDVRRTPWSEYEDMVLQHGFPGPAQHRIAYIRLKERRLAEIRRDAQTRRGERVILVTGVRLAESVRRMGRVKPVHRAGSLVWVAPILDYDGEQVRQATAGIPPSDASALIHRSGECNCGAFAQPREREMLAQLWPEWWRRFEDLEGAARDAGKPCVWGQRPPSTPRRKRPGEGQLSMPGPLCAGCTSGAGR